MNSPSSPIKLVFWNCASLAQRLKDGSILALLNPELTPDPPTILALVETRWVDRDSSLPKSRIRTARLPYIPNYTWAHRHHTAKSGGIAVLYHNSIACLTMAALNTQSASLDNNPASAAAALWLTMRYPHSPAFLLGVGYLPPFNTTAETLEGVRGLCASLGLASTCQLPVLLLGDFNLHHSDWEDAGRLNVSTVASSEFANYMKDNHWSILNPILMPGSITRPTHKANGFDAVIDLAITDSPHLFTSMDTEYKDVLHSDHYPVTLTAMLATQMTAPPAPTHTRRRTQWNVHHQPEVWQAALPAAMEAALGDWVALPVEQSASAPDASPPPLAESQQRLDRAYAELEAVFIQTCEQVVGTRVSSATTKHWFGYPGIKSAYKRMKHTRRVWKRSRVPCAVKIGAALVAMDAWKALVREAMAASWSQLCADIQSTPKSKLQWTLFKRSRGRVSSPLTSFPSVSGEAPAHIGESLNHLCDHFVAASVPPALDADSMDSNIEADYLQPRLTSATGGSTLPPHESDDWTFTPADVEEQCTFQHTNSAPGCDAILPILLKHAGKSLYVALSGIFTYSWRYAVLPQQWTEANVMALYKGKGVRSEPASYRPISMTSIIIRTFEHLIHKRLSALLEKASFFHPLQFGFRKNHSTLDAINYLQYNTRAQYVKNVPCPTLFLDLQKAFDRVWHPKLLQTVERAGVTGRAWKWLHAFLSHRRIRTVDCNHQSEWRRMEYGVPQGAVLSPLLFNIFINVLAKRLSTACLRLNVQLYADDIAIQPRALPLVNGRRPKNRAAQSRSHPVYDVDFPNCFRLLNQWCMETRMRFGEGKTEWVVFDTSRGPFDPTKYKRLRALRLCGFVPRVVQEYNYLGVTHHRRLSWDTQATEALARARQDSHMICRLIHPPGAPHFPAVRALCLGYLRARCTYALAFWTPTGKQVRQMQAAFLRPIQRVLGLPNSSHHLGALVEAHCPSFEALRTHAAARFLLRAEQLLLSHPTHPTSETLRQDRLEAPFLRRRRLETKAAGRPLTNFAETVAVPHLINNVLAHLPQLAQAHALNQLYFPAGANMAMPLPATLTVSEVNTLLMVDTHREWRADAEMTLASTSTAPLLAIKTSPRLSLFLVLESNPMVSIRARLRANRLPTQERRYRQLKEVDDPSCTYAACRVSLPAPPDNVPHIFMYCPRHQAARQRLVHQLRVTLHHTLPLSLAFVSGEVMSYTKPTPTQLARAAASLALTADFIHQVITDRSRDGALKPFTTHQPVDLRPEPH